jgi:lipopolysaccharide/colanic/teichoic acid biosynthesis glycosyltransferase
MKRAFDLVFAILVLIASSPVMLTAIFLVWAYDRHSPFYRAPRVARGGGDFRMLKIRSMVANADRIGGSSTSGTDRRITPVGHYIRKFKLDELSQFWNVLMGDMSVVGPRPQIRKGGVDLYTPEEMGLLNVRPGVTDLSSIVFSDEGSILAGAEDADALYDRIIRPWKSRLGLLYVRHSSIGLDLRIVWLTALAILSKPRALAGVERILARLGADPDLIEICRRRGPLPEGRPPGAIEAAA